eukprot:1140541-Pelagomonas_calceolata.AAC.1
MLKYEVRDTQEQNHSKKSAPAQVRVCVKTRPDSPTLHSWLPVGAEAELAQNIWGLTHAQNEVICKLILCHTYDTCDT